MPSVTIVGIGRIGGALAARFFDSPYSISYLIGKKAGEPFPQVVTHEKVSEITDDLILLTVPDDQLAGVALDLTSKIKNNPAVLHTSGPLSSEVLSPLGDIGCHLGSLHPLISFSDPVLSAKNLSGAYFCVEGDTEAVKVARELVSFFRSQAFEVSTENKVLYHAAAVTACGHLTALIDVSQTMLKKAGLDSKTASKILIPLIKSTVGNIEKQGTAAALTGTFARADIIGFERQLAVFSTTLSTNELEIYLSLAQRSIEIAVMTAVDPKRLSRIEELISLAKS